MHRVVLIAETQDNIFNGLVPGSPFFGARLPTGTSQEVQPIVGIAGDRNNVETVQEQYRAVLGVKGDLAFISPSWEFDVYGMYSKSEGSSIRRGIREDRLALSLGLDPTSPAFQITAPGNPQLAGGACATSGFADPSLVQPDLVAGCVPVNLFAPSLFGTPFGDFASQAERDYLFGRAHVRYRIRTDRGQRARFGYALQLAGGSGRRRVRPGISA